jgi:hypothetical protein
VPVKRYLAPSDFTPDETWRLVEWCRKLGADEFTIDSVGADGGVAEKIWRRFKKGVKPFSRGAKTRERMSGPTADELTRSTLLWELNHHTLGALRQALPGGLLQYEPVEGGWFEDPVFYREGRLMLGILSHEAFAVLCISESESAQLAAAGFATHDALPRIS